MLCDDSGRRCGSRRLADVSMCSLSQLGLVREKAMVRRGRRGEGRGEATISHILRAPGGYGIYIYALAFFIASFFKDKKV